jgi:hypothetical protein
MCSPCGAHLRDLCCAAHTKLPRLATFPSRTCRWVATFRVRLSTVTSCSPSRCLRSRSSFDVRARIHAPVSTSFVLANVPRRSLCAFTLWFAPCEAKSKRVHLLVLVSAFVFRRSRPDALRRLTVHGLARSCHVSTAHSSDPLSVRGPSLRAAPVHRVRAHLATITFAWPYGFLSRETHLATCSTDETQSYLRVVSANFGRRCPRTPRPKLSPLPRRPDRPASLDAHDPKALPCSRSRNVAVREV